MRDLGRFLVPLPQAKLKTDSSVRGEDLSDIDTLLKKLRLEQQVPPAPLFRGGTIAAKKILKAFLEENFSDYAQNRNQPHTDDVSHMSKCLHFGQISPLHVALEIHKMGANQNTDTCLEKLIVCRELPTNYVFYELDYNNYGALPDWTKKTLAEHKDDAREPIYTRAQLENAETHDPYWKAAMLEMKHSGYMHNYMRMYWGRRFSSGRAVPRTLSRRHYASTTPISSTGATPTRMPTLPGLWAARPCLDGAGNIRQGALYVGGRFGA